MNKLDKNFIKILDFLGGVCMIILTLSVAWQVVAREVLQISATWTTEVGRFMFMSVVFLGLPIKVYENSLMNVSILPDMLAKKKTPTLILNVICDVLAYFVLITLCYTCLERAISEWGSKIPSTEWMTYGYQYAVMLFGSLCMVYAKIRHTMRYLAAFKAKEEEK